MNLTDGKITIKDKDNKDIVCDVLFTFDSDKTNKSYIVFTDNTKDEEGNLLVYANTYNKDNSGELGLIETEEEWNIVEQILDSINKKEESDEN